MKYKYKRVMTAGLAAAMLCTNAGGGLPVYGAEAAVDVDETMYVNLDYYGRLDKINVVKGCSLNGLTDFTDYGTYLDVTNMSNQAVPVLGDGSVTWNFPQAQKERFYYKCALDKDQITLNGVPSNGDQLAGASGLVEIHIKADPNDHAREYYRNNMMLMVAVPVDMGKCYSVEAEGSQTQNLGETTAVVFTALPGEEGDYTVRIGTDSFETTGVIMAMMPGTVEDLEHIKDLKEAKDTWQDAGDELYDSLEQMAKSVEDMREGVNQVRGGLDSAESARQKWSNSKDSILAGNDQTLASLTSVSQQLETMIPHLQTAKDSAEVVHKSMGDIVNTLGDMQDPLRKLHTRLNNIKSSSAGISENIPELMEIMQQLIALDAQLQASEQVYVTGLASAGAGIGFLDEDYYMDEEDFGHSRGNGGGGSGSSSGHTDSQGKDTDNTGNTTDTDKKNDQSADGSTSTDGSAGTGGSAGTDNTPGTDDKNSQGTGGSTGADGSASTDGSAGADNASGTDDKNSQGTGGSTGTDGSTNAGSASGTPVQNDQGSGSAGSQDNAANGSGGAGTGTDASAGGTGSGTAAGTGAASGSGAASGAGSTSGSGAASGADSTSGTGAASDTDAASGAGETLSLAPGSTIMAVIEKHNVPLVGTTEVPVDMGTLMELLSGRQSMLTDISKKSSELSLLMSNLMDDTSDSAKYSAEIVDNLDYLIEDLTALHDSLDTYYPDLQAALDDSQELVRRTTDALNNGVSTMTIVQNTLKDSSDDFDAAARDSLRGSMELLDRSLSILDSTTAMRRAGRTMKDTIDNELDKFDTDNRFLFMDPSSEKVSFTSDKNRAPKTLQIVLRTDEISVDEDDAKTADAEVAKIKESPLRRMWNVLVQMWKAMVSIFKNR